MLLQVALISHKVMLDVFTNPLHNLMLKLNAWNKPVG